MEFKPGEIKFEKAKGEFPRVKPKEFTFSTNVQRATVILTGADFGFSPREDRRMGQVVFSVALTGASGPKLIVSATLGVRDWSGDVDDEYEGIVYFTIIAETA